MQPFLAKVLLLIHDALILILNPNVTKTRRSHTINLHRRVSVRNLKKLTRV